MVRINYNGQTMETKYYRECDDETRLRLKQEYFEKPPKEVVIKQLERVLFHKGTKRNLITRYYFRPLISKVKVYDCKWCVEDIFESNDLMGYYLDRVERNPKCFTSNKVTDNIETAVRLGSLGVCRKPTLYPIDGARNIIEKYCENNEYYDYSCGWGDRLLASASLGVNYYGVDPNNQLLDKLIEMSRDFPGGVSSTIDVRCQGSEEYVPDWENKMSLAFSSPPYFKLEDYKIGEQSTKKFSELHDWFEGYMRPTIANIWRYLIDGGYFVINIKNYDEYDLVSPTRQIAEELGFKFVGFEKLTNKVRINQQGIVNNDEDIMVFRKECENEFQNESERV